MKKIGLNPRIDIDFPISDKVTITVSYKALKGKKAKELSKKFDPINNAVKEQNKLNKRINVLELKATSLSKLGKDKEVIDDTNKLDKLYDKLEKIEEKIESLGGFDKYEEFHKLQFSKCIESKDIKKLEDAIEDESTYFEVMQMIIEAVEEKKGN